MSQINLFNTDCFKSSSKVVNVASVPQRSPFRYAGGKTWLVPKIRQWLLAFGGQEKELFEPFAGGGIVSLTAAFEDLVGRVTMVEKDEGVAAVWQIVLGGGAQWLAEKIINFHLTPETAKEAIESADNSLESLAFATVIKNRVNRGGILADGASFIKKGENGKGIASRWYPETLKRRILEIDRIKEKIEFILGDAFEICEHNSNRTDAVYFIDPPYMKAGRRLYRYSAIDHQALFNLANRLKGEFLLSYDNTVEVRQMASCYQFSAQSVAMKNTHHAEKTELLISRNLSWLSS